MSLSTGDTKESLSFSQGETDTIMLSVYAALISISPGYSNLIVIDAEDTGVYIQAAAISHDIPGIMIPLRSNFLFCRGMCTEDFAKSLMPFHVLTGCDANSCFSGYGKIFLYENCQKVLRPVACDVLNDLKSFAICYIYIWRHTKFLSESSPCNQVEKTKEKILMRLLPDDDNLEQHIKCAIMVPTF